MQNVRDGDCILTRGANEFADIVANQPKDFIYEFFGENFNVLRISSVFFVFPYNISQNNDLQEILACIVGELVIQNCFSPADIHTHSFLVIISFT